MKHIRNNGAEISSCIISQVRFELRIKDLPARNNKTCSTEYWNEVVEVIGRFNNKSRREINNTKK